MFKKTIAYIQEKDLFSLNHKLLVALSGGVDSMVLMDILVRGGYNVALAHCNFKLRGKQADEDTSFVKEMALKYKLKLYLNFFETKSYAKRRGISTQMAARDLRYEWFASLSDREGYDYVVVAHHLDDNIETVLLNFIKGTGIQGMRGMKSKNSRIVRPLLSCTKRDIINYAKEHTIIYREDASNADTYYERNKLRHQVLPVLEQINPSLQDTFAQYMQHMQETEQIYKMHIKHILDALVHKQADICRVKIADINQYTFASTVFYELIKKYGFIHGEPTWTSVEKCMSGKMWFSKTHRILRDREVFFIAPISNIETNKTYAIDIKDTYVLIEDNKALYVDYGVACKISRKLFEASIDLDKIEFPLTLRKWKEGDVFVPLGMRGKKKVSDYLIDNKVSLLEKEDVWVLCNKKRIIWLVGYRIDNRFKIDSHTQRCVRFSWTKSI